MGKNWAIVVGINQYRFLQPLKYAKRDAEVLCTFLQQEARFDRIFLFTDDSPEVGGKSTEPFRANLLRVLRQIFEKPFMNDGDNFWFFFSGHGIRHREQDYLMPLDGDPEDVESTGISTHLITNYLRSCGADNTVIILDACRSEGKKSGEGVGRKTEAAARQTGVISIFSCNPEQYSYEIEAIEQGAFTFALLEGLGVRGRCATVERLNQYLLHRVPELVQQHLGRARQIPYTIAEPMDRSHLILMPQHASLQDIADLKNDAYRAQMKQDWDLAKRLWIRVLAAASGQDMDAIEALQQIAINKLTETSSAYSQPVAELTSTSRKSSDELIDFDTATGIDFSRPHLITSEQAGRMKAQAFKRKLAAENAKKFYEAAAEISQYDAEISRYRTNFANSSSTSDSVTSTSIPTLQTFKFEVVTVNTQGREVDRRVGQADFFAEDLGNGVALEIVKISGGSFEMGLTDREKGRRPDESPRHTVNVPSFFIGKFVVTQAQYQAIMGKNPANFRGEKRPVEKVSWSDAIEFCDRLSKKTGRKYRLPSEAEWEYACRAGTTTPFHFGETITSALVNYDARTVYRSESKGKYRQQTTDIGTFLPNTFGLYDMHGNVLEWCADHYHDNYRGAPIDGSAWLSDNQNASRLLRGGSCYLNPDVCRSAYRVKADVINLNHVIGFRVVCSLA